MEDLERKKKYPITKFDVYEDTQFQKGNCVRVVLEEGYLILPQRFNDLLEGDTLSKMNAEKMVIIYHGKTNKSCDISFETV